VLRISDRREAIKTAVMLAGPGDVILVAGKGHEPYQEINGIRHHFDDREEIKLDLQVK
jgi:UDP-N-acetylmuramoyl-L-alanyl-D-glutamate--2,6-diaminopimelate ligase